MSEELTTQQTNQIIEFLLNHINKKRKFQWTISYVLELINKQHSNQDQTPKKISKNKKNTITNKKMLDYLCERHNISIHQVKQLILSQNESI
jgi:hypothetical protein